MKISLFTFSLLLFSVSAVELSAQVSQWQGPERNGHFPGTGLLQEWPEGGPELFMKIENLNMGYSSPVLHDGLIYIAGKKDDHTVLSAVKLDGEIVWETIYGQAWESSYPETRNTPTIEDSRIYITAGMGDVNCIDAKSGKLLWSVNTHEKYHGEFHRWGFAESLLLTENAVISSPVGNETVMVALDKKNGELIWKTESLGDVRSYASPLMIDHNGRKIIIATTSGHIAGIDPMNGKILWKYDLVTGHTTEGKRYNTNTPLYHEGCLFTTCGYDAEGVMLKLADDGESVSLKWSSDALDTHHGGVVQVDGFIYGANWLGNGNGNWICLDWDTGELMYDEHWNNKGSIIYADNRLYLYEERRGNVGLLEPGPSGFNLKGSFRITEGTGPYWAHPTIYESKLFLRHGDVLMIYDIAKP